MNKKEILGLCEFLKLHGYENTDNISKFIFGLQQENKQIKEEYNKIQKAYESTFSYYQQLKDKCNKLKEFIVKEYYMYLPLEANTKSITILIDKMNELEGSDSNGQ